MPISSRGNGRYDVSGTEALNLRWSSIFGRATDDDLTLNKKNIGGWAMINMGAGDDTVTLGAAGDYTLQLVGVETIQTTAADTTLRLRSDATTSTDGSFEAISATYGIQNITYTAAVRDSTLSLGAGVDEIRLNTTDTLWGWEKVDGVVKIYDISTGYSVQIDSTVEWIQIGDGTGSDSGKNGRWEVSAIANDSRGGYSLAAAVTQSPITFNSSSIDFISSIDTEGYASAYGFDTSGIFNSNDKFGDFVYIGFVPIGQANSTTTISLSQQSAVVDGYLWTYFWQNPNNQSSDYGPKSGAYRLILGSGSGDTGGAMDQSGGDTLVARSNGFLFYNNDMLPGYAMYGFDGNDAIAGGNDNDTIYGGTGSDTITGGAGNDNLYGEDNDDTFVYNLLADFIAAGAIVDSITGGSGTDIIRIDDTAAFSIASTVSFARASGVETLAAGTSTSTGIISITLGASALTAGIRTVTLAGDTSATGSNVINVSAAVAGQDLSLTGSAGNDAITGGAGADTITGGGGADTITLGTGVDTVVFDQAATGAAADTVTGFSAGAVVGTSDLLQLSLASINGTTGLLYLIAQGATPGAGQQQGAALVGDLVIQDISTDNVALTGNVNAVRLTGATYANDAAALADLLGAGNRTITLDYVETDAIVVIYDTGADTAVAVLNVGTDGDQTDLEAFDNQEIQANATLTTIVTLVGVTAGDLIPANIAFIA